MRIRFLTTAVIFLVAGLAPGADDLLLSPQPRECERTGAEFTLNREVAIQITREFQEEDRFALDLLRNETEERTGLDLPLQALADTRVFFEKEMDLSSIRTILKEALTAEKDSIVFYLGMKDMVPEKLGKDKIDWIIKEEMAHICLLSNKLKDLK